MEVYDPYLSKSDYDYLDHFAVDAPPNHASPEDDFDDYMNQLCE